MLENTEQVQAEETQTATAETVEQTEATTEETAPVEAEAKTQDGEEAATEQTEEKAKEEQAKTEEKHKRAGGWQRKIERLEREREMLLEQLTAQRGTQSATAAPEKPETPEEKAAKYIDDLVEKRLAAKEAQRQQQEALAKFEQRKEEVRAAYSDFDEVMSMADAPVSRALGEALLTSEHGPAIMYQLAKNPAELARISALPPLAAAREIGRLEAKASATPTPKAPTKSVARPPAPPTSVSGSASSTRSLDDLSLSDYKRAMRSGGKR